MKPIEVITNDLIKKTSAEICDEILNIDRWKEFKGYSILPGIKNARFDVRTPEVIGSRINVLNTDGSSHVEEIIEWDVEKRISLKFQEFNSPVRNLATHFIETWEFRKSEKGTETIRRMTMYPKGFFGWMILIPISILMKKALAENLRQINGM